MFVLPNGEKVQDYYAHYRADGSPVETPVSPQVLNLALFLLSLSHPHLAGTTPPPLYLRLAIAITANKAQLMEKLS